MVTPYYLEHWQRLLEAIPLDSLPTPLARWSRKFLNLSQNAQLLVLRLYARRPRCFAIAKLSYDEINIPSGIEELKANYLIRNIKHVDLEQKKERLERDLTKAQMNAFHGLCEREELIWCYHKDLYRALLLSYFGDRHQDLSTFVISELEHLKFESYETTPITSECMNERLNQWHYFQIHRGRRTLFEDQRFHEAAAIHMQLYTLAATDSELRHHHLRWSERIELKIRGQGPTWKHILKSGYSLAMLKRRKRHLNDPRAIRELKNIPPLKRIPKKNLDCDLSKYKTPELAVLSELSTLGKKGLWAENGFWKASYALFFWKEWFSPVPGQWPTPYQGTPLDLGSPRFYERRQGPLSERIRSLSKEDARKTAKRKEGLFHPWISWNHLAQESYWEAFERVPLQVFQSIFARLQSNPKAYGKGLPDLLVWDDHQLELLEVKGPGDRPREEQSQWLRYLIDSGISASYVYATQR